MTEHISSTYYVLHGFRVPWVRVANLTLSIDDDVLLRARKRALDHGTSVNAVLRKYLESYAGREDRAEAMQRFVHRAANIRGRSRRGWTREELHER